jgi:hypothetical protein
MCLVQLRRIHSSPIHNADELLGPLGFLANDAPRIDDLNSPPDSRDGQNRNAAGRGGRGPTTEEKSENQAPDEGVNE